MGTIYDIIEPHGVTKPASVMIVSTFLPILALIAVALRFNVRRIQKTALKSDDWIMISAALLVTGMSICGILGVTKKIWGHYLNADSIPILFRSITYEAKLLNIFQYIQVGAIATIKVGALLFYKRIFCTNLKSTFRVINTATITFVAIWAFAMILGNAFRCGPHFSALWHTSYEYLQYCNVISPVFVQAFTIINFVLDLWIILLPLPMIFHLKTNTGTKLAVYGVFLLASIGLAASITRAAYIIQMFRVAQLDPDADSRLGDTLIIFWSNLEASVCLLAVNLPSLWAYKTLLPPTQFLASVRSFIAIQFGRSTTLNQASHEIVIPDNRFENSSSSVANMCANNNWVDVYAMHELESQNQHIAVPEGAILVDSHVLLTTQNKNVRGHE